MEELTALLDAIGGEMHHEGARAAGILWPCRSLSIDVVLMM
ncbi:hypothetical protein [Cereibacter changlensis]|uniref:Uncharacterized protein n=1 Tax=Cereibacter changlensis TaxID=402884 RepID=A0A2W7QSG1_9RHOB|nr:hypothetical protein [Cereibacter changlensis]PZX49000.1 hypothetical protein LX76_04041 [Cereibacter changlensis]